MSGDALEPELRRRAEAWRDSDPDPETRAALDAMIAKGAADELAECLAAELDFGTAGLRGAVGPGPARMNRAVVIRAARALAEHFLAKTSAAPLEVVVGYDARSTSRSLAEAAAGVFLAAGFGVRWFEAPVPTPLVAYAARVLGSRGAVVITASHNPREDNGLKAYDGAALQLAPPDDSDVERRRAALPGANQIPCWPLSMAGAPLLPFGPELEGRYLDELESTLPARASAEPLRIAYTPLHGVGLSLVRRAFERRGGVELAVVAEQALPDGRFPTTPRPNPEEPGTLDLVLALARRERADLVLANDPDADRLAAAVPRSDGEITVLSGNELGVLLADFVLSEAPATPAPLLVTSVVSTPLLERIAASRGARFERTLTGFKWIWLAARSLEVETGVRFAFGCEEALGYSIGHLVRDKDGIAAAVWLAELAARSRAQGQTLLDRLDALHVRHGAWVSAQRSLIRRGSAGSAAIQGMMARLGASPPAELASLARTGFSDYSQGAAERPRWFGKTPLFELSFDSLRLLVRPSGTEPKLKIYADASEPVAPGEAPSDARDRARARAVAAIDELVRWLESTELAG